jgi:hypothetical protein
MAEKVWADWVATGKRMHVSGTRIEQLELRTHDGERLSEGQLFSRSQVMELLETRQTLVTATLGADGIYRRSHRIVPLVVDYVRYLKTRPDNSPEDKLELPEV